MNIWEHINKQWRIINVAILEVQLPASKYSLLQKGKGVVLYKQYTTENSLIHRPEGITSCEWTKALKMTANVCPVRAVPGRSQHQPLSPLRQWFWNSCSCPRSLPSWWYAQKRKASPQSALLDRSSLQREEIPSVRKGPWSVRNRIPQKSWHHGHTTWLLKSNNYWLLNLNFNK